MIDLKMILNATFLLLNKQLKEKKLSEQTIDDEQ